MSSNDGKQLEHLVELIERTLLPPGFSIETRRPVHNEEGVQVAELDIFITGNVGSAMIRFLVECRDRPSEGSAPVAWIEQLVGRRQRLKLDKVMAVSSTGFSPGAMAFAADSSIDLRHLEGLSIQDVAGWLPSNAPLFVRNGILNGVRMFGPFADRGEEQTPINDDGPKLRFRATGESWTLKEFWRKLIANDEHIWDGIVIGEKKVVIVSVTSETLSGFVLVVRDEELPLTTLEFDATLEMSVPTMPLVQAAQYIPHSVDGDDAEAIARVARWVGSESDRVKEVVLLGFPERDDGIAPDIK